MKYYGMFLLVSATVALGGCSNGNVNAVKNAILDENPSFKIGQAFDNRKVCDSVNWGVIKDDRDRSVVEYRCSFKGVDAWVSARIGSSKRDIEAQAAALKDDYIKNVSKLQSEIQGQQEQLSKLKEPDEPAEMAGSTLNQADQNELDEVNRILSILRSGKMDAITSQQYSQNLYQMTYSVRDYKLALELYAQHRNDSTSSYRKGQLEQSQAALRSEIDKTIEVLETYVAGVKESEHSNRLRIAASQAEKVEYKNQNIQRMNDEINENQEKVIQLTAGKDNYFASVDDDLKKGLAQSTANPIVGVDEVFQWVVEDDGKPTIVYAGTETKFKDGRGVDKNYGDSNVAVQMIIENKVTTYVSYLQEFDPRQVMAVYKRDILGR